MKATHPASPAPIDYSREVIEILGSASSKIRAAAMVAKANGMEFTLEAGNIEDPVTITLTIPDPARPHNQLRITMTRKSSTARPAHEVAMVGRYTVDRLQVAQIHHRLRRMIDDRARFNEKLAADAALVDPSA